MAEPSARPEDPGHPHGQAEEQPEPRPRSREILIREAGERAERKMRGRRRRSHGVWFGLGMFGTVGWSVAIPTLLGAALGIWMDANWPGPYSWTLVGLLAGVALGCLNAWYWVSKEREGIERERKGK
jgi:ATP synthase protein I